jgi:(2Fe-2S) ferredoxin
MEKPKHHMLLCASFRVGGEPKGYCHKKGSTGLLQYIEEEVLDRGMDVLLSTTGCLKQCEKGPVVVIYPDNIWYGGVESESAVDEILDALENESQAESLVL